MAQLTQADLVYRGAFKVPTGNPGGGGTNPNAFAYPQGPLAYNPANNSLFMCGHVYDQRVAEIAIPAPVNTTVLSELNTATIIQHMTEPLEGKRPDIYPGATGSELGGLLVYDGELYVTAYIYYDASAGATKSHFKRPLNLSTTGQVAGPVRVNGDLNPGYVAGPMCLVPAEHQAAVGKPALTGQNGIPIFSRTSWGPSAFAFDPGAIGQTEPVPVNTLVYYPQAHPTLGVWNGTSPLWNGTAVIKGVVFPAGYDSVLYFGRLGVGEFCYGTGPECGDPAAGAKGNHAYPYVHQAWCYALADLLAVKNGTANPWDPIPTTWTFDLPFQTLDRQLGGAAYDAANGLIYLVHRHAAGGGYPLIQVFEIAGAPPAENATITRSSATVRAGDTNTVTWADITTPAVGDLVGLFTAGLGNDNPVEWFYLNNTKVAPGSPVGAAGNFAFTIPRHVRGGTYAFRLLTQIENDDGFGNVTVSNSLLATSESFTVQGRKVRIKL